MSLKQATVLAGGKSRIEDTTEGLGGLQRDSASATTRMYLRSQQWRGNVRALHYIDDVIHHDAGEALELSIFAGDKVRLLHARELRPHLNEHAKNDTLEHAWLDKCLVAVDGFLTLEADLLFDFLVLGKDLGVVDIAATMKVSKDLDPAALLVLH